jgi:hypothetical protein
MPFLHPSGGLVYHLRAWRYGKRLWPAFHAQVRQWLAAWQPVTDHVVLVGPSGGYALNAGFLDRFPHVTALEPDPLARIILARRFPCRSFRFEADPGLARSDGFSRLALRYPDAAFLFCNLLGQQLVGQGAGFQRPTWLAGLAPALAGRHWASWHDLASTRRLPDGRETLRLERGKPLDEVLGHFWRGGELAILDHECSGLLADAPREYAIWELCPGQHHLVEWLADT